jgi:hypothetical protein
MLYKLSIKPTRLELLKLIYLDKSKYREIRVAVKPLPFRFNRGIIDSDEFFQQFVDIVNDFLETYRQDISELFVSLKENYFQVYDLEMQEFNEELVHWEIVQYLTDDISNYRFGSFYLHDDKKVYLVIARTKLIDYFQKIFKSIYGKINFTAIGYDLKSNKTETIFIKTDQEILDYYRFGYSSSWNPENDIVTPQKPLTKYFIGAAIATALAVAVPIIYFSGSNEKKPTEPAKPLVTKQQIVNPIPASPQQTQATTSQQVDSGKSADIKPIVESKPVIPEPQKPVLAQQAQQINNKPTKPVSSNSVTDIYQLLNYAVIANSKSVIINKNQAIIEYQGAQDASKSLDGLKSSKFISNLKTNGKNNSILTFALTNSDFYQNNSQNYELFQKLSERLKLSTKYNYRIFSNSSSLASFITEMQKANIRFSHLVISKRGNLLSLAVDFK